MSDEFFKIKAKKRLLPFSCIYFLTGVDNSTLSHLSTSGDLFNISPIQNRKKWKTVYIVVVMGRHEPVHYMKYELEKPMRFCGMNV